MNKKTLLPIFIFMLFISLFGCKKEEDNEARFVISPSDSNVEEKAQNAFLTAVDGDVIYFKQGTYNFSYKLSIDGKKNITIKGDGIDKTIISFADQVIAGTGAEGILCTNTDGLIIANLKIENTPGDGIKVKDSESVAFYNVAVEWTGDVSAENGAYAIYPVTCSNVLIDGCYVRGASDAGIYVGQSNTVIVRNSKVQESVAGIEIENTKMADVYNNETINNTGGILVFDLPGLPVKEGGMCRIYNNKITDNVHQNFATAGNMVANVPPGTGVLVLATRQVEIFNNTIVGNNTIGVGVVNFSTLTYFDASNQNNDPDYNPAPSKINIHSNTFTRTGSPVTPTNSIGTVLNLYFPNGNDIAFDGVLAEGETLSSVQFCIKENTSTTASDGKATFQNLDLANFPNINPSSDVTPHTCSPAALSAVSVNVRKL